MSLIQYEGRTVDMQAWSIDSDNNVMVDASTSGTICTGIVKLAQRFLITFLNRLDSIRYNYWGQPTEQGTRFMTALQEGWIHTEADVYANFAMGELQARQQLLAQETGDEPADERYKNSRLLHVEINQDGIRMTISIESQSDSVTIIIPIPIMVPA